MMNATLHVEFMAGTGIEEAISEAKRLAHQLKVRIEFKFNGTKIRVNANSDIQGKIDEYHKDLSTKFEQP